jgi:hypothetical protein
MRVACCPGTKQRPGQGAQLYDRLGNGVRIMAPRGLQLFSLDQFGDHFSGIPHLMDAQQRA